MKRYKRIFVEEENSNADSIKAIKDLIDLDWSKDEDAQSKALALFKGLVYADTPSADAFIKKVSDYTSGLKAEEFEESKSFKETLNDKAMTSFRKKDSQFRKFFKKEGYKNTNSEIISAIMDFSYENNIPLEDEDAEYLADTVYDGDL